MTECPVRIRKSSLSHTHTHIHRHTHTSSSCESSCQIQQRNGEMRGRGRPTGLSPQHSTHAWERICSAGASSWKRGMAAESLPTPPRNTHTHTPNTHRHTQDGAGRTSHILLWVCMDQSDHCADKTTRTPEKGTNLLTGLGWAGRGGGAAMIKLYG